MRVRVECSCGWQRELSEFYAGKRIRCADCGSVLEVPGASLGFYSSRQVERELNPPSRQAGEWLPLTGNASPHRPVPGRSRTCGSRFCGNSIVFIMVAVIVALNIGRILHDTPRQHESPPASAPREVATPADQPVPAENSGQEPAGQQAEDVEREDEF